MNRISRHLAAGVLACVCAAAAAQAQIVLYEHDDFKGRSIRGTDVINNLRDRGFNDLASSIKVLTGTWEVCTDADFRGNCTVLEPGQYPSLRDMDMNDRLSSVRSVSERQAGGRTQIVLYEHDDFQGRELRTSDAIINLDGRGFNDIASSIKVLTGTWEVCSDANFRGNCTVLEPGQYRSLRDLGINDSLSSLRRVSDGQRGGYGSGTSSEYQRGYNDGRKGYAFDNDRHPQDYKDGYRAGEEARARSGSGSSGGEYEINRLSDGGFEVVWPRRGCIGTFNSRGEAMSFNERCNDDLIGRSREIARRER